MTQEDIIRMAREAGYGDAMAELHGPALERFAQLVAAAEREACAKLCENGVDTEHPTVKGHIMNGFGKSTLLADAIRAKGQQ